MEKRLRVKELLWLDDNNQSEQSSPIAGHIYYQCFYYCGCYVKK